MLAVVFALVLLWVARNLLRWPRALQLAVALVVARSAMAWRSPPTAGCPTHRRPPCARSCRRPWQAPRTSPPTTPPRLAALGDVIPLPPLRKVLSAGDLLIAAGVSAGMAMRS